MMLLQAISVGVAAIEAYAIAGVVFAAVFLTRGFAQVDPRVVGAPRTLRLLILPGIVALWPLFARRWATGASAPIEDNPHRARARVAPFCAPRAVGGGR
jgi:hypothetical protein